MPRRATNGLLLAEAPGGVPDPDGEVTGLEVTGSGALRVRPPEVVMEEFHVELQLVAGRSSGLGDEARRLVPVIGSGRGRVAITDRRLAGLAEGTGALGSFGEESLLAFALSWSTVSALHLTPDEAWPVTVMSVSEPSAVRLRSSSCRGGIADDRLFRGAVRAASRHHLARTSIDASRRRLTDLASRELPTTDGDILIDLLPTS
jgi:hypothetical protein